MLIKARKLRILEQDLHPGECWINPDFIVAFEAKPGVRHKDLGTEYTLLATDNNGVTYQIMTGQALERIEGYLQEISRLKSRDLACKYTPPGGRAGW